MPWKRIVSSAATIVLALVAVFTVFLAYGSIANRFYRVITIEGDSMAPTLHYGDQVVVRPPKKNLPPGTIVLLSVNDRLVTHRLLRYDNGLPVTKGDANQIPDNFSDSRVRIIGIYTFRIPKVGYISLAVKNMVLRLTR